MMGCVEENPFDCCSLNEGQLKMYLQKKYSSSRKPSKPRSTSRENGVSPLAEPVSPISQSTQAKLQVGAVNDPLEREADRVADRVADTVVRTPAAVSANSASGGIQRKPGCSCGGVCPQCAGSTETPEVLRKVVGAPTASLAAPPVVNEVVRSSGQPLDASTKSFMEQRFGQDFSHVRVHTDSKAADAAQSIQARAFTVGSNVVFNRSEFTPQNASGKKLLAHELTHVVQQQGGHGQQVQRTPLPGESTEEYELRRRLIRLIPNITRRIRNKLRRGTAGLFEFETIASNGEIRTGGAGSTRPTESLQARRQRLLGLIGDMEGILQRITNRRISESWMQALSTERARAQRPNQAARFHGFGGTIEILLLFYDSYAAEVGRLDAAFENTFYIRPASAEPRRPTAPSDTLIDVIVPDPRHPEHVQRLASSTSANFNPETGEAIDSEVYRVHRDERGYYYLRGPAWLGPHRRVDLPGRP